MFNERLIRENERATALEEALRLLNANNRSLKAALEEAERENRLRERQILLLERGLAQNIREREEANVWRVGNKDLGTLEHGIAPKLARLARNFEAIQNPAAGEYQITVDANSFLILSICIAAGLRDLMDVLEGVAAEGKEGQEPGSSQE